MSLAKASLWTAASTLVKIGAGLLVGKLLAVSFGPAGLGLAANFRQLITVLGVLAGAGIFNGVTKYVAQYHDNPQQLRRVVGTSSAMVLGFSTLMALVFVLAAAPISQGLFGNTDYQGLVRLVALVQMGIAWGNLLLALMKGFRDAAGNALSLIVGSLIGVLAYYVSYRLGGYEGALLGLALIPALVVIPAAIMLIKRGVIPLSYLKPSWDNGLAGQLSKFTLMALITSVTLPVAYIMMRKLLAAQYSWDEVGIWQGVSSISDAYLQFITASFSVYLLPTLSRLTEKRDITREVVKSLKFVLPAVAAASFTVWLLRDFAIWLLLSNKNAEERLAAFIYNLSRRFAQRGFSPREFRLTMTRGDIGNYLGLTVETISRLLGRFQKSGMLAVKGKYITIENNDALAQLAGHTRNVA